jgi:membrane-associated phospholipid phosphatase
MSYKKSGLILSLGAILVGIGRVLAGLHFYKDIIWGLGIGFIVSLFVEKTVNWISAVLKLHLKTLS